MSTLHCFCAGELLRDPEKRTSSNGNGYVTGLLRVGDDTVVSVTAFDTTVAERLASLKRGAALAVSGRLSARPYQDRDGTTLRAGLSVTVTELMGGAMPPTKAQPRARSARPAPAPAGGGGEPFDDELPPAL